MISAHGSAITMGVQKVLNRKKDKAEVNHSQVEFLEKVNARLDKVVEQLQEIACYREPCKKRVNGKNNEAG